MSSKNESERLSDVESFLGTVRTILGPHDFMVGHAGACVVRD